MVKNKKPINQFCPNSGKAIAKDSLTVYQNVVVGFCNPTCRNQFSANPQLESKAKNYFDALIKENQLKADIKTE